MSLTCVVFILQGQGAKSKAWKHSAKTKLESDWLQNWAKQVSIQPADGAGLCLCVLVVKS